MKLTGAVNNHNSLYRKYAVTFLVACFLLMGTNTVHAQKSDGKIFGGLGYFALGYSQLNLGALNDKILAEGFPEAATEYMTTGGGGHAIIGNVIIGGEGHSLISKSNAVERIGKQVESRLDGGYGFFNIGYVVLAKKALLLYPVVGVGSGGMNLRLSDAPEAVGFQNLIQDHQRSVVLENSGFLFNFQLGADFMMSGKDERRGGFLLGIHAGYLYTPGNWEWKWDGTNISDGPEVTLGGPYVRLTLGGGGYSRLKFK